MNLIQKSTTFYHINPVSNCDSCKDGLWEADAHEPVNKTLDCFTLLLSETAISYRHTLLCQFIEFVIVHHWKRGAEWIVSKLSSVSEIIRAQVYNFLISYDCTGFIQLAPTLPGFEAHLDVNPEWFLNNLHILKRKYKIERVAYRLMSTTTHVLPDLLGIWTEIFRIFFHEQTVRKRCAITTFQLLNGCRILTGYVSLLSEIEYLLEEFLHGYLEELYNTLASSAAIWAVDSLTSQIAQDFPTRRSLLFLSDAAARRTDQGEMQFMISSIMSDAQKQVMA